MEKLPIKLNDLSIITNSFIEMLHHIETQALTLETKDKCMEDLVDIAGKLKEFFTKKNDNNAVEENRKRFHDHVQRIFDRFEWEVNFHQPSSDFIKYSEYGRSLISSLLKLIGKKGCGILIIETYIKICLKTLGDLTNYQNFESDTNNFKLLLEGLSSTANLLKKYWNIVFMENQRSSVMLCLSQISKCLILLLKMIKEDNKEIRKYFIDRLMQCFNKILAEVHNEEDLPPRACGSEFIQLMDSSLHILTQLNRDIDVVTLVETAEESLTTLKSLIDELLCHAMSIAQVTHIENDYKSIVSTSQKILTEFTELTFAVEKSNGSEIKLNANSVSEILCQLEQKVNTAVLRLVLEVFTDINTPLKDMVTKCRLDSERADRAGEDLNVLISDFDIEMDRIMQIGLFAVSCSSDVRRVLSIRSCLASLESLESELIPCLTTLYVEPNDKNKANFQFLVDHWLKEITELKLLVDSIIDPAAFSEVVETQVRILVDQLKDDVSSTCAAKQQVILARIVKFSKKLVRTLLSSVEDEDESNREKVKELIVCLQHAVQECEASTSLIQNDDDANDITVINRIIKRCELVLTSINNLFNCFIDFLEKNELELDESKLSGLERTSLCWDNTRLPEKNYYKLCSSTLEVTPPSLVIQALTPFLNRGKLINKERSGLYTTPKKIENECLKKFDTTLTNMRCWDKTPKSRNRSRCCRLLPYKLELTNTLNLEITDVLENLSQLSCTFNSSQVSTQTRSSEHKGKNVASGQEKDIDDTKPVTSSRGCLASFKEENPEHPPEEAHHPGLKLRRDFLRSLDELSQNSSLLVSKGSDQLFDTPDRLRDLQVVEQKINFLKQQLPDILP